MNMERKTFAGVKTTILNDGKNFLFFNEFYGVYAIATRTYSEDAAHVDVTLTVPDLCPVSTKSLINWIDRTLKAICDDVAFNIITEIPNGGYTTLQKKYITFNINER